MCFIVEVKVPHRQQVSVLGANCDCTVCIKTNVWCGSNSEVALSSISWLYVHRWWLEFLKFTLVVWV
jgi:hypothetical protein